MYYKTFLTLKDQFAWQILDWVGSCHRWIWRTIWPGNLLFSCALGPKYSLNRERWDFNGEIGPKALRQIKYSNPSDRVWFWECGWWLGHMELKGDIKQEPERFVL